MSKKWIVKALKIVEFWWNFSLKEFPRLNIIMQQYGYSFPNADWVLSFNTVWTIKCETVWLLPDVAWEF